MRLVYGHDFSDVSSALVGGAAALASRLGLPLVLVHVRKEADAALDPDADARLAIRARERLEALAVELTRAWPGCHARAVVLRGHPASELAAEAARNRADLLVVSSGRHGGPLWRTGSTSERVAVEAECPVLVLRASEPFEAWARSGRPLRVVLGVSDDAAFAGALAWTSRLRIAGRCDVTATEVYSPPEAHERYGLRPRLPWTAPDPDLERLVTRDIERRLSSLGGEGAVAIHPTIGLGRTADHLLDVAERSAAHLVVVGTHRARGLARLTSVSEGVLHHGRTSVLLVPGELETVPVKIPELRRVLVPVDLSPSSSVAVVHGLALARAGGGEVHLLHVVETEEAVPSEAIAIAARLRGLVPDPPGVPVRTEVVGARDPGQAIVAAAERIDADVICLASHGRAGVERLALGSVAEQVVRSCRRPVLVVHPVRE